MYLIVDFSDLDLEYTRTDIRFDKRALQRNRMLQRRVCPTARYALPVRAKQKNT